MQETCKELRPGSARSSARAFLRRWLWLLALAVGAWGCTGSIDGQGSIDAGSGGGNAGAQGGLVCQAGQSACNGVCVDLAASSTDCGRCGAACAGGTVCANGTCGDTCRAGYAKCDGNCVNVKTDSAHCGACGKVCDPGQPCVGGVCGCPEASLFCQGQCHDPLSDNAHCGSCENACSGGASCIAAACKCRTGEELCGTSCVSLGSKDHCGACGKACGANEICALNACIPASSACPSGLTRCGDACVNLASTPTACGSCTNVCPAAQACNAGRCGCPPATSECAGACVNTSDSVLHCGACGAACTSGQACHAGKCECAEASDVVCDGRCVDPRADVDHCGGCNVKCSAGLPCTNGKCACPDGETSCGGACVNTDSAPDHCGNCTTSCPEGESCSAGKCSGSVGDSCKNTVATGISITDISIYQAGKVQLAKNGATVAEASRAASVVQGKPARFRVFVKLESGFANRALSARLRLTSGAAATNYYAKKTVSQASSENSFATTFNIDVPGEAIEADLRYAIEIVECDGAPTGTMGSPRFPATGDEPLTTRKTGTLKVKFIPLNANGKLAESDSVRLELYKAHVARVYPIAGLETSVGAPLTIAKTVSANGGGWAEALDALSKRHEADNAPNDLYYYGLFQPTTSLSQYCNGGCVAGIGYVANAQARASHQRVALGLSYGDRNSAQTMAHEVGHNHGRPHSPCGGAADPDSAFPYAGGKIGWWGYEAPEVLHDPATDTDIMGYCNKPWVSDYVFRLLTDRVATINAAAYELPPPGGMSHFLFLLVDGQGPRWGLPRSAPRYPSGEPEGARILDAEGHFLTSVTVYRTETSDSGGGVLLVPDPEPGWHAIELAGQAPLAFGAVDSSF